MDCWGWCPRCGGALTQVVLAWAGNAVRLACVGLFGRHSCGWSGPAGFGVGGLGKRGPKDDPLLCAEIGRRVKRSREVKGWTQPQLAEAAGLADHSTVAKVEQGIRFPSMPLLAAFAKALDCRPKDLLP